MDAALTKDRRVALFVLGCMPVRCGLVYMAKHADEDMLRQMGTVALIPASVWAYLYATEGRMAAPEGGGITWWANLRPLHAILYASFAYLAIKGNEKLAPIPLALDASLGMAAFLHRHQSK